MDEYDNDDYGVESVSEENSNRSFSGYSDSEEEDLENQQGQYSDDDSESGSESEMNPELAAVLEPEEYKESKLKMTIPYLTKYEKAKLIGIRATQIAKGSPIYVILSKQELDVMSALEIAEVELKERKIPFIVRRVLPNG